MEEKKSKKLIIFIIAIIVLSILSVIGYNLLNKDKNVPKPTNQEETTTEDKTNESTLEEDETEEEESNTSNNTITDNGDFIKLETVILNENNQIINVNGKDVNVKVSSDYLYINDAKTNISMSYDHEKKGYRIDVSDHLIFIYSSKGDDIGIVAIVDENGKTVPTTGYSNNGKNSIPFAQLSVDDGKIVGVVFDGYCENTGDSIECGDSFYSFSYNEGKVKIQEIK